MIVYDDGNVLVVHRIVEIDDAVFVAKGDANNSNDKPYSVDLIKEFEENGVDLILPGETLDWTVVSYIRDSLQLGKNRAMIVGGHFNMEELGMKYLANKLDEMLESKISITYVPSEDIYSYYKK